jgi:hypothetical protein
MLEATSILGIILAGLDSGFGSARPGWTESFSLIIPGIIFPIENIPK